MSILLLTLSLVCFTAFPGALMILYKYANCIMPIQQSAWKLIYGALIIPICGFYCAVFLFAIRAKIPIKGRGPRIPGDRKQAQEKVEI